MTPRTLKFENRMNQVCIKIWKLFFKVLFEPSDTTIEYFYFNNFILRITKLIINRTMHPPVYPPWDHQTLSLLIVYLTSPSLSHCFPSRWFTQTVERRLCARTSEKKGRRAAGFVGEFEYSAAVWLIVDVSSCVKDFSRLSIVYGLTLVQSIGQMRGCRCRLALIAIVFVSIFVATQFATHGRDAACRRWFFRFPQFHLFSFVKKIFFLLFHFFLRLCLYRDFSHKKTFQFWRLNRLAFILRS